MKKTMTMLTLGLMLGASADAVLERFDDPKHLSGSIIAANGAEIVPQGGMEGGALKAKGQKKNLQYIYTHSVYGKPGDQFSVALNYTSSAPVSNNFLIIVTYHTKDKGKTIGSSYFKLGLSTTRWTHRQFQFTLPENATKAEVALRLANVPPTGEVMVDFLRIVPVVDGTAKGIDLETFDTTFDGWAFDKHLIFDHFMPGRGGKVVNEWREAKVGEAFFQAEGSGEPMQYALYIDNIKVKPQSNYVFEAWYKATENFNFHANGMLIFFYKDSNGKDVGQSRFHIRSTNGEWKELLHSFTTPENCAFVDIGLNLRKMKATDIIKLDHIRFHNAGDKLYVRTETDSHTAQMRIVTALTGNLKPADIASGKFDIRDKTGAHKMTVESPAGETAVLVDLKQLPDGEYTVTPELSLKDGRRLAAPAEKFGVYNHPDWRNDIGIQKPDMTPPMPWKALKEAGKNAVDNWNGRITFDPDGMIRQIRAGQADLLSSGMNITLNGQKLRTNLNSLTILPSLASGELAGENGNFLVSGKVASNYTGFTRYTLSVKARAEAELDEFQITLPVCEADFVSRTDGSWSNVGAVVLKEQKSFASKNFYDNILLGTLDRGISFYLPKLEPADKRKFDRDWLHADQKSLRVNLVGEKIRLKEGESKTFDFAVCAYPYRPAENNWRRLRFRAGRHSNFNLVWQTSSMFKYAGSLAVSGNDKYMKEYLAKQPGYRLFYQCPPYILETIPQWSFFKDRWLALPSRSYNMPPFGKLTKGNFRSRLWQDLYVKTLVEMLENNPWDGVYYDCYGPDVFLENGEQFNPVFELRDFHERIYNAQRISNHGSLTVVHAGADQGSTMCAYADVVLMGEQYRAEFYANTYFNDFMSIDRFRCENASNIGPDRMILPQYRQVEKTESPKVATHVSGMATLHNLMMYPNFIHSATELSIRDRMYDFGLTDADFIGYWQQEKARIQSDSKDVFVSHYDKRSGAFATVLNYSDRQQTVRLAVPFQYRSAVLFDPLTGRETPFDGKPVELEPSMAKFITFTK